MAAKKTSKKGNVQTTVTLEENKEFVGSKVKNEDLPSVSGETFARIRMAKDFKMSHRFQTVGVTLEVDMPVPCRPGHLDDLAGWDKKLEDLIDEKIRLAIEEAPEVIRNLAGRKNECE